MIKKVNFGGSELAYFSQIKKFPDKHLIAIVQLVWHLYARGIPANEQLLGEKRRLQHFRGISQKLS